MTPDAIVVLAGSVKREGDRWMSTDLSESADALGAPGQLLRVEAAVILAQQYPEALIVLSGGKGYDAREVDQPLLCEVMRHEMTDKGISAHRIILESGSNNTYQQIGALQALMIARGWKQCVLITNRWHAPRTEVMLSTVAPDIALKVIVSPAEEILIASDPGRWKQAIEAAYQSSYLKARMAKEEEGVRQIKAGTYQFR